ncbi:MAG: glycosyltransferase family 4 protein [Planctomycetes bacterium]|nr:glycosyltransferase family 4 protein [Planctomycetota bacterium]
MKVLILSDYFSTWDVGGASRVLAGQIEGFRRRPGEEGAIEVELISGSPGWFSREKPPCRWYRTRYKGLLYLPRLAFLIAWRTRVFRPDLLHIHQPLIGALAVLFAPRCIPRLYHFHSYWLNEKQSHSQKGILLKVKGAIEAFALRHMRHFVALSHYSLERLKESVPEAEATLIPGSIDTGKWTMRRQPGREGEFAFLSVRRLEPRMGLDQLIKAFARFHQNAQKKVSLTLVGEGRLAASLRVLVDQLDCKDHIHFTGRVDDAKLLEIMSAHQCMVVPSKELEGFGMVVIEAFSAGLPVLATRSGALGEFSVHDDIIHFMPDAELASFEKGLAWAAQNFDKKHLSEKARKTAVGHYDIKTTADTLFELYERLTHD